MKLFAIRLASCSMLVSVTLSFSTLPSRPSFVRSASSCSYSSSAVGLCLSGHNSAREKVSMRNDRTLVRRRAVGVEEFFTPSIILLGAAAVSVYAKDGQLDLGSAVSKLQNSESTAASTVAEEVKEEPAPATAPAPAPVKATKRKSAPSPTEPAAPAPAPALKTTTELVKEVASKIEDQRATEELVASRKAAKEAGSSSAGASSTSEPEDDFEEVLEGTDKPKSGKKRKFVLKVIKKVIAPWRKWENIQ